MLQWNGAMNGGGDIKAEGNKGEIFLLGVWENFLNFAASNENDNRR